MAARSRAGFVRCIVLAALSAQYLFASSAWLRLTTRHFDLYSSLNAKRSAALFESLENARRALELLQLAGPPAPSPLRVIAFGSSKEYAAFRLDRSSPGYYLHSPGRDYIVLAAGSLESTVPVVHEYVHYLLHRRYKHLPLWLDEGLAEFYSTIEEKNGVVKVGLAPDAWLDSRPQKNLACTLPALFGTEQSPLAGGRQAAPNSRFYAQAWLLVHMLWLAPGYASRRENFLAAVEQGESPQNALLRIYGKSLETVENDLANYINASRFPMAIVSRSPVRPAEAFRNSVVDRTIARSVLADLLEALGRSAS